MRQLKQRVREQVRGRSSDGAVREHEDQPERDLIRDHVSDRPTRQAHDDADRPVLPRREESQVDARAAQRGDESERHGRDRARRP